MTEDLVRAQGYMMLGSRLRRIGERLQADVQRLAKTEGIAVPSALFPTLAALDRYGAMTVNGLADALGVAQPGVTRNVALLAKLGLVTSSTPKDDQRVRSVSLSRKGAALVARVQRDLWRRVDRAVAELCDPLEGNLLAQLDGLEAALDISPLDERARGPA